MSRSGRCLPLEQRIRLYNEALHLHQRGLRHAQIVKEIYRLHGTRLDHSHISYWVRGIHRPLARVNCFEAKPSPDLAYVIGVWLSDGWRCKYRRDYILGLGVTEYEFAEIAGIILTKLLNRKEPYKPRWDNSNFRWVVKCCSIQLYYFLNQTLDILKTCIEHCPGCAAAFLRAVFDGEGSIGIQVGNGTKLTFHNTNEELLGYVQQLLRQYFGISATAPHKSSLRPGEYFRCPRNHRTYTVKKQCYYLYVPVRYLPTFRLYIGFTIKRKHRILLEATQKQPSSPSFI